MVVSWRACVLISSLSFVAVFPSEMCSSRSVCGGNSRPSRSPRSGPSSSGAHYALCALGVGLIALGIVMIVWTVMPMDKQATSSSPAPPGNSTSGGGSNGKTPDSKSSVVAMVLVGVGAAILLLSICLGVRSKKNRQSRRNQAAAAQAPSRNPVAEQQQEP